MNSLQYIGITKNAKFEHDRFKISGSNEEIETTETLAKRCTNKYWSPGCIKVKTLKQAKSDILDKFDSSLFSVTEIKFYDVKEVLVLLSAAFLNSSFLCRGLLVKRV